MKKYLCLMSLAGLLSISMLCVGADASEIGNANAIELIVAQNRNIRFNGKLLTASGLATLQQLESYFGSQLADGAYWYDARMGAFSPNFSSGRLKTKHQGLSIFIFLYETTLLVKGFRGIFRVYA
jgi:hypothetical protein